MDQQQIDQFNKKVKDFVTISVRRDGGKFSVDAVSEDANGLVTTIDGTITDKDNKTVAMSWNITGKSLNINSGFDLVKKVKLTDL
jgi:hypothetical protein